jgi:hypothetical protein
VSGNQNDNNGKRLSVAAGSEKPHTGNRFFVSLPEIRSLAFAPVAGVGYGYGHAERAF